VGKAIVTYYAAHPHYIWVEQGHVSGKAIAAMAALAASDRYGLQPADYRVALPDAGLSGLARHQALLRYELALSAKALTYVLDARRGRVAPDRISGYHDLPRKQVDLVAALGEMAQAADVGDYLKGQNPDNARFRALTAALQKLRTDAERPRVSIDADTKIKPGEENPALANVIAAIGIEGSAALKKKHAAELAQAATAQKYAPDLVALVRDFQKERGLSPDGIIGPNTVKALSGNAPADKIEKIVLAMERLRWLPRRFGERYVFLNEPAFTVNYIEGNKVAFSTKAVIGQVSKQTFFFTDHIKAVEYNP
jgi:L,D-transpeptidase YcbB